MSKTQIQGQDLIQSDTLTKEVDGKTYVYCGHDGLLIKGTDYHFHHHCLNCHNGFFVPPLKNE